jgi:tetratricopeptide (TPR) repeat protein
VQLLGKEHADTIASKAALGCILHGLGRWNEAIELFQEAIDFFARPSHRNSYEVARNLNNLAAAHIQVKVELQAAEKAYRRALDIKKKLLGTTHTEVAITLNNLAMLLKEKGKIPEAKKMLEQALIFFRKKPGIPASQNNFVSKKSQSTL